MNNVYCEIIEDLIPLYCDGVCSEESKKLILAHIETCEKCKEDLCLMDIPMDRVEEKEEVNAANAASKAWKKNKQKAFRTGGLLVTILAMIAVTVSLGLRYMGTTSIEEKDGLEKRLEVLSEVEHVNVKSIMQKGDYLAVSGCDDDGLWHLGIFSRDEVFSNRWRICGSLNKVKPGKLADWNFETAEGDTILVCFGAELPENICGYMFSNSGVTYTCTVNGNAVLDLFYVLDSYDSKTYIEAIYQE